jgi:hypothetical protein
MFSGSQHATDLRVTVGRSFSIDEPRWSDTRNADPYTPANGVVRDEDIFTDNSGLPNRRGKTGVGQIGKR